MEVELNQKAVFEFLDRNEDAKNQVIYDFFGVKEPKKKTIVRVYKSNWKKKKKEEVLHEKLDKHQLKKNNKFYKLSLKQLTREFIKFVGYVGFELEDGSIVLDKKGEVHEGEAFPPPIDEKGRYLGILKHEVIAFKKIWRWVLVAYMMKWPRGFGKTYVATWFIEFTLKHFGWPWLYLSSTDIIGDVAYWIYKWAFRANLIIGQPIKGGKRNTYTQFELKTGGKMRIFEYLGEEMVGQHGWFIFLDDIIKKKWEQKPTDNVKAKRQWLYSISFIRRLGLVIVGTRKYQGDPLEFLEETLVAKGMRVDVKTPYIMEGEFPDWEPVIDLETGREKLWVPELYSWEEIENKKVEHEDPEVDPYLAFQAEMMQNPLPRSGGLCEESDLHWTNARPNFAEDNVQMVGIGVDSSWGEGVESDYTAIVSCVMNEIQIEDKRYSKPQWRKRFTFIAATLGRMPTRNTVDNRTGKSKNGIMETIQMHFNLLRRYYPGIRLIIAIERNANGIDIINTAQREIQTFTFGRYIVEDSSPAYRNQKLTNPNTPVRLGITHTTSKASPVSGRIFAELQHSIKEGEIEFLEELYGTELINQLTVFPRGKYDDGPDAAGMIKDQLNMRYRRGGGQQYEERKKGFEIYNEAREKERYKGQVAQDLSATLTMKYGKRRRSIF